MTAKPGAHLRVGTESRVRVGRVLLARGRDASDVAIATTFGPNMLENFKVWADEEVIVT